MSANLNTILIAVFVLLTCAWALMFFRRPIINWLQKHPLVIKIFMAILLLALAAFAILPFVFIFKSDTSQ